MKKLLYICEATGGGVRKHIVDLLNNIDLSKYNIYFIYSENRADEVFFSEMKKLNNKITFIKNNYMIREISPKTDWEAFKKIYKTIKEIKPDIVHCHSSKAGVLGRIAAKLAGVKKIYYTPHAYSTQNQSISRKKKFVFNFVEMILSRFFTTKTLNVSNGEKKFALQNKLDKENKFNVIYNGITSEQVIINKSLLKEQLELSQNDFVIGVAARLDEQKDPWTFVKIAERVLQKDDNVKFIYIGDGKFKDEIEDYLTDNGLQNKILLLGFRSDVECLLQIFDVYLITSLYEGLPYSLIEALKAKLPIIATNIPGNDEIVFNEFNGLLFKTQNMADGAEKIDKLLNGLYDINEMGKNSYKLFEEKFTINNMISKIEQIYEGNCNDKGESKLYK